MIEDIKRFYEKIGLSKAVAELPNEKLKDYLDFRQSLLFEEYSELDDAINNKNPEEIVDALIDIVVICLGTLDNFQIDTKAAWNRVLLANMTKEVGLKEGRPNKFGLPDLIKPKDWVAPNHSDNYGLLTKII